MDVSIVLSSTGVYQYHESCTANGSQVRDWICALVEFIAETEITGVKISIGI